MYKQQIIVTRDHRLQCSDYQLLQPVAIDTARLAKTETIAWQLSRFRANVTQKHKTTEESVKKNVRLHRIAIVVCSNTMFTVSETTDDPARPRAAMGSLRLCES